MNQTFNAGVWTATGTLCRRTLEGIVGEFLADTERGRSLAQNLGKLAGAAGFGESLVALSDALREGGNIASHFDPEKEPDQETAEAMLDLTEYLLEYIYALPKRIERLTVSLGQVGQALP